MKVRNMSKSLVTNNINLPNIEDNLKGIEDLTNLLRVPRTIVASNEEISEAWQALPRELKKIPQELRDELIGRMCVAVSVGLFDGAMNYIWNASIIQLRQRVRDFGLPIIASINSSDFEEKHLLDLQDSNLIKLCLDLNIIDEDAFFFLDQCRAVRNNYSAAHPTIGKINDTEFLVFLNRCVRYALTSSNSLQGIKITDLIFAIKDKRLNDTQKEAWTNRVNNTHNSQQQMIAKIAHGIYCDPQSTEFARLNALDICRAFGISLTNPIRSELLNQHHEFIVKDGDKKYRASIQFFENLGLLSLLSSTELHSLFFNAIKRLWDVHNGMNNFYNEPAFAERLLELTKQNEVPQTVQDNFVETVICCCIGNNYGVSNAAVKYYDEMIEGFSPMEVATLIRLANDKNSLLGYRIRNYTNAKTRFSRLLHLIDHATIPAIASSDFNRYKNS